VGLHCALVEFLLHHGMRPRGEWWDRGIVLQGTIPTAAVAERFCVPGAFVQAVNMLEVRPERIRVMGLGYEEYTITAQPWGE